MIDQGKWVFMNYIFYFQTTRNILVYRNNSSLIEDKELKGLLVIKCGLDPNLTPYRD
jgi:hypothetical protein